MISELRNPKSARDFLRVGSVGDGFRMRGSWLIFLFLCSHLIFCHGCHGEDVDDELCISPPAVRKAETQAPKSERNAIEKIRNPKQFSDF
jgi:hypothetical protein